jgi:hypothetical protein
MPSITQAFHYNVRMSHRVRYSPYAFDYGRSGLIPGGLKYSAHASGLVFEGARYTPHAFGYGRTGLIVDYHLWHAPYVLSRPCVNVLGYHTTVKVRETDPAASSDVRRGSRRPAGAYARSVSAGTPSRTARDNAMTIIRRYLHSRGFRNVGISRILSIDGQIIGVDFTLRDRNLIVKYWNPPEAEVLASQPDYKRRALEKHRSNWERFAAGHTQRGGKIHYVQESDKAQIVAALDNCEELHPGIDALVPSAAYAKQ